MKRTVYVHDHTGGCFGALTVTARVKYPGKDVRWHCICDCGASIEAFGTSLRNGRTRSCGCQRPTLAERLDKFSIPEPNTGCTLWFGSANVEGYGRIRVEKKTELATHIALRLVGKVVPKGMFACHHCDVPACINTDHLYIGTRQQNVDDMNRRGRASYQRVAA